MRLIFAILFTLGLAACDEPSPTVDAISFAAGSGARGDVLPVQDLGLTDGTVVATNDKFPAAKLPATPGSASECYVEARGTVRVIGRAQPFTERRHSVAEYEMYVPVVFTPPPAGTPETHVLMCAAGTRIWIRQQKLLQMLAADLREQWRRLE